MPADYPPKHSELITELTTKNCGTLSESQLQSLTDQSY